MSKFVSLDEAAKMLGMSPEKLVEARSSGEIHGYRDGASWKFKIEEVERFQAERGADAGGGPGADDDDLLEVGDLLGEDDDDAILVSEQELGGSETASSTIIGRGENLDSEIGLLAGDSDLKLAGDNDTGSDVLSGGPAQPRSASDSDVQLVPDPEGSDVRVVAGGSSSVLGKTGSSDDLKLDPSSGSGTGELTDSVGSSDFGLGSDLGEDDEVLSLSEEDDLVLASGSGTGSDITMGGSDTGINLASPSDSGLLLEDDALDLGSVSSLELPEDDDAFGDTLGGEGVQKEEEFALGPVESVPEVDDEGSSQVIALEDSVFGEPIAEPGADVFAPIAEGPEVGIEPGPVMVPAEETHFSAFNIMWLSVMVFVLALSGMLMIDVVRNMWSWNDATSQSVASSIMDGLVNAVGLNR